MTGTWISNPFTTPFIVYLQYRLGCLMMGREPIHIADGQLLSALADDISYVLSQLATTSGGKA
jgi:uncharacterized protein (DUF2062 family)